MNILQAQAFFDGASATLSGAKVVHSRKKLKELPGVFADSGAFARMDPETVVYEVDAHQEGEAQEGGLLFGISHVHPGKVGDEFFMTKGHYHALRNRAEYYWGLGGEGLLLLMQEDRSVRVERVCPGSLHYIPGNVAHRLVNTGLETLHVGACWPSDAGHDYQAITDAGFPARVVEKDGRAVVI